MDGGFVVLLAFGVRLGWTGGADGFDKLAQLGADEIGAGVGCFAFEGNLVKVLKGFAVGSHGGGLLGKVALLFGGEGVLELWWEEVPEGLGGVDGALDHVRGKLCKEGDEVLARLIDGVEVGGGKADVGSEILIGA